MPAAACGIVADRIPPMSGLRMFLLWLVMVAVPLQGYAAASMAFCADATPAPAAAGALPMHDHGAQTHASAAPAHTLGDVPGSAAAKADVFHKCASCSSCAACHAVALTGAALLAPFDPLPHADVPEASGPMATRVPRVPDRPPRA
jgi:hypothetical protein